MGVYLFETKLEAEVKGGKDLNKAIQDLLPGIVKEHKRVILNGNGFRQSAIACI